MSMLNEVDNSKTTEAVVGRMYDAKKLKNNNPFCNDEDCDIVKTYNDTLTGQEYIGINLGAIVDSKKNINAVIDEEKERMAKKTRDERVRFNSNQTSIVGGQNPFLPLLHNIKDAITFEQDVSLPEAIKYDYKDGKIVEERGTLRDCLIKCGLRKHNCKSSAYLSIVPIHNLGNVGSNSSLQEITERLKAGTNGKLISKRFEEDRGDWSAAKVNRLFTENIMDNMANAVKQANPEYFPDVNKVAFTALVREFAQNELVRFLVGNGLSAKEVVEEEVIKTIQECPIVDDEKNGDLIEEVVSKKFVKTTNTSGNNFSGILNGDFYSVNEEMQKGIFGNKKPQDLTPEEIQQVAIKLHNSAISRATTSGIKMKSPVVIMPEWLQIAWNDNDGYYKIGMVKTRFEIFLSKVGCHVVVCKENSNFGAMYGGEGYNDADYLTNLSPMGARKISQKTTHYTNDVAEDPSYSKEKYESQFELLIADLNCIVDPDFGGPQLWMSSSSLEANQKLDTFEGSILNGTLPASEFIKQSPILSSMCVFYPFAGVCYKTATNIGYRFTFDYSGRIDEYLVEE